MDLSKSFTDWNEEELTLAVNTFTNWHNNRNFGIAVCKFSREDLGDWINSLIPDLRDGAKLIRYQNHLILNWLKLKLVRSEGREFIAMVGTVVDDEFWIICGVRVDRLGLLSVLKNKRGVTDFTFEHHKVERTSTFDGALRIAGFSVEDISNVVAIDRGNRGRGNRGRNQAVMNEMEDAHERARDRDVT